jgi:hypothetical protein
MSASTRSGGSFVIGIGFDTKRRNRTINDRRSLDRAAGSKGSRVE